MNLFRRISNLWNLSSTRPLEIGENGEPGDIISPLIKKMKIPARPTQAIFIKRNPVDPIEEILKQDE